MKTILDQNAIFALTATVRDRANLLITAALNGHGVNDLLPAHGAVLQALFTRGPLPMSDLALAINRKKNTVTSLIQTMEERGYCRREADKDDARKQWIHPTPQGEALRDIQADVSRELLSAAWDGITPEDRKTCLRVLSRIIDNLTNYAGPEAEK